MCAASSFALAAIWLGYPLIVPAVAALRWPPRCSPLRSHGVDEPNPGVSVVLATRDSVDAIVARITNAPHTSYPPDLIQIVVALDAAGAKAEPSSLTEALPNAIIVTGDAPGGKAAALNVGVRAATGDLLVFCDTAQRFDVNTLPALTSALRHPEFGAVSGALTLLRSEGLISPVHLYWSMEKWLRERESLIHSAIGITGAV